LYTMYLYTFNMYTLVYRPCRQKQHRKK